MSSRSIILLLSVLFVAVFVVGMLPGPANLFLLPLLLYGLSALLLVSRALRVTPGRRLRRRLLFTGLSALGFTAGLLYGVAGMWGFYEINDPVYLGVVIASTLGFVVGALLSVASLGSDEG